MAPSTRSALLVLLPVLVAFFGGVFDFRLTAPLPAKPWTPFPRGRSEVLFKNELKNCESVVLDHVSGVAILSCDPGRDQWNPVLGILENSEPHGALYLYNYAAVGKSAADRRQSLARITLSNFPAEFDFHPLGINIHRAAPDSETICLFVSNLRSTGPSIDVFTLNLGDGVATYHLSIASPLLPSPNSIAAVSPTAFYATNNHRFNAQAHAWLSKLETLLRLPISWVSYVDFTASILVTNDGVVEPTGLAPAITKVAGNICFANGIVVLPTPEGIASRQQTVVVASTCPFRSTVNFYDRDLQDPTSPLVLQSKVPMPFAADNVGFDNSLDVNDKSVYDERRGGWQRGLTVAGHVSPLSLFRVAHSPLTSKAPSWVVELRRDAPAQQESSSHAAVSMAEGHGLPSAAPESRNWSHKGQEVHGWSLRSLYRNDGSFYGSSTTGVMDDKRQRMLVSGLYGRGLLQVSW